MTRTAVPFPASHDAAPSWLAGVGLRQIRLTCALVLFTYLLSHFVNHALGNISMDALQAGKLDEAFGAGTAATIAPIATIGYEGEDFHLPAIGPNAFSKRVAAALEAIRTGSGPDVHGWMVRV